MSVMGRPTGRGDIRLIRGDTQQVAARWRQRNPATGTVTPVDLTGWTGTLELRSPDGLTIWHSQVCSTMSVDGMAVATLSATALAGSAWDSRRTGQWRLIVREPASGQVRTLAWGYWTLD